MLVLTIITACVNLRNAERKGSELARRFIGDNYLFIICAVIPVIFFAVTKSYLTWYTYTSQIAMCVLTCRLIDFYVNEISAGKVGTKVGLTVVLVALSLFFIVPIITRDINLVGTGGHPVDQFTEELLEFREKYGDSYSGVNAYLISNFRIDENNAEHWEAEYVAPAEMYLDLIPVDGNIDNFLSDPNALLILDKDLWDEYSGVLTGHVILNDSSYLVLSSDLNPKNQP